MYRKDSEGWLKHFDFLVLDLLCLVENYCIVINICENINIVCVC